MTRRWSLSSAASLNVNCPFLQAMFKRRMKFRITSVIIIKSCSYRPQKNGGWMCKQPWVTALVSAKTDITMYLVIKFQKPFQRLNLKLLGLHFTWKWAYTGKCQSWKQCISPMCSEEPGLPAGTSPPAPWHRHWWGLAAGMNPHARDDRWEPTQKRLYRKCLLEPSHTSELPHTLSACGFGLLEAKQSPSPLCVAACDCSRLSVTGLRPGGGRFKEPTGQDCSECQCSSLSVACCQEFITIIHI